jgi:protein PhnA
LGGLRGAGAVPSAVLYGRAIRDSECNLRDRWPMTETTRDSNGTILNDGDSVTLIKDLKVKGTSETLKRGTLVKNIRLTGDAGEIECNTKQVKGLVLKTEFLKKA